MKSIEYTDNEHYQMEKMEQSGVERIFGRSIMKNKLRYTEYCGDGDTKCFSVVKDEGVIVVKKECIGHVQTRVGTRLRKLKKQIKDLGTLGLNDPCIDRLQSYYGIAVRSNVGDISNMKKAMYAYHWTNCLNGGNSRCSFQRDKANNTNVHVPSYGLGKVIKHVKPIFEDLSKDELLSRCLHGKTSLSMA